MNARKRLIYDLVKLFLVDTLSTEIFLERGSKLGACFHFFFRCETSFEFGRVASRTNSRVKSETENDRVNAGDRI